MTLASRKILRDLLGAKFWPATLLFLVSFLALQLIGVSSGPFLELGSLRAQLVGLTEPSTSLSDHQNPAVGPPSGPNVLVKALSSSATLPPKPKALTGKLCSVRFMAVGDILIHQSVRNSAALPNGSYDFKPAFELVAPIFRQADLVIGNLENPLAGSAKGYSGYPMFNAPEQLAQNLKDVGFTSLNLTNNHSLDRGLEGLKSTIAYVREAKLDYSGAYLDEEDKKNRLVSFYNGVGVALLGYTYGLNVPYKVEPGLEWRLGVIDKEQVERDVAAARATGADFVVVSLHFGNEYELKPNAGQRALAEALFNSPNGAPDLILGHHPHVVQPFVEFKDKSQAVIFSLGNFISSQPFPYTFLGLILDLRLTIHPDGHKSIEEINFIPTYCHKIQLKGASRRIFRVTPMAVAAASPKSYSLDDKTAKTMAVHLAQQLTHLKSLDAESLKAASSAPSSPKVPSINQAAAEVSN